MKKAKEMIKKFLASAVFMIVCGGLGFLLGMFIAKTSAHPIFIIVWMAVAVILYLLQIILHEAGHFLFGKLSGYTFVSFRVGNYTWIKEDGKYVIKKFKIPGTAGQCLMMPPETDENGNIFTLYHMGGVLVNLFFTLIGILLFVLSENPNVQAFGFILGLVAGVTALSNGIPFKAGGVANDGYNVLLLKKDKIARRSTYIMLKVNGLLTQGIRMKEMPYEWFVLPEEADLSNSMNATIRIMEGNWFFDKMQFEEAKVCYETLLQKPEQLLEVHKMELECEMLFFELIGQQRKEVIEELYTKKLKSYVKTMSPFTLNKKRLQYALCLYEKKSGWEAELEKIYEEALKVKDTYPVKAEAEGEMEVIDFLRAPKQIFAEWEENNCEEQNIN